MLMTHITYSDKLVLAINHSMIIALISCFNWIKNSSNKRDSEKSI